MTFRKGPFLPPRSEILKLTTVVTPELQTVFQALAIVENLQTGTQTHSCLAGIACQAVDKVNLLQCG